MTITNGFAELSDITLHYAEVGRGHDTLVIFLHGFPEFWYTWRQQLPVIGTHFHAVAPDLRGYNLSDRPEDPKAYTIGPLINDVIELAHHFGHEKFYLVSHDWGAAIGWSVALAHPDRVKGLCVLNGPHPYIFSKLLEEDETQIAHSQYMADFREPGIEEKLQADNCEWLWDWTFKKHFENGQMTQADKNAYLAAWQKPGAIRAMLNYYRNSPLTPRPKSKGVKGLELDPDAFIVKVPTLLVWGEQDHALVPANIDGIEVFVPDLKILKMPNVSHWVTHEAPKEVAREVLAFLTDLQKRQNAAKNAAK
ncbi:alpha/beta fold hydrolase [Sneathiella aquimaris]|uniref:alpha/beta fold hydrolase n=1 Tax=Sneathiella aquimaris TaxID=2599305 RepID=UPI00146EDBA2|nr:alpha/beta hydrolase [Sneathiella aquimaris]